MFEIHVHTPRYSRPIRNRRADEIAALFCLRAILKVLAVEGVAVDGFEIERPDGSTLSPSVAEIDRRCGDVLAERVALLAPHVAAERLVVAEA